MKVTIEIAAGHYPYYKEVTKSIMDESINAVQKAIDLKPLSAFDTLQLSGVRSILEGIKKAIKE